MMLKDEIAKFKESVPAPLLEMTTSEKERLERSGILNKCLAAGDRAPDFALPDQHGNLIFSQTLLTQGPLILTFYRGGW